MKITLLIMLISSFLFSKAACFAKDPSIENPALSYDFREITKPLVKDARFDKLIVLSDVRVGSALLYMILQYIFEDTLEDLLVCKNKKVVKTHYLSKSLEELTHLPTTYIIVPTRNPIDAFCSYVKAFRITPESVLTHLQIRVLGYLELKKKLDKLDQDRLLFFKYEEFNENFHVIFDTFESKFQITISDEEKEKINTLFSKDAVKGYFKKLGTFRISRYDHVLGMHGEHISSDTRTLNEIYSREIVEEIYRQFDPILPLFGY